MNEQGEQRHAAEEGQEPVVVRDRRRIDPQTGEVRPPTADEQPAEGGRHAASEEPPAAADPDSEAVKLRGQLDERTADLQRLTAEYANYRKRVERDREVAAVNAKAGLVGQLLAVLDDVERAEAHNDLTGAFKTVADKLVGVLQRSGLAAFGDTGEEFDPSVHEAVQHSTSPDVSGPTVTTVLRRGYRFGDRVVRAALVEVTDHEPGAEQIEQPAPVAEASSDVRDGSAEAGPEQN